MKKRTERTYSRTYEEVDAKITDYLESYVARGGRFIKAKEIGKELGLTAGRVGVHLKLLSEISERFAISQWADSKCITWCIIRKDTSRT